jgi:hypothetical protein
MGDTHNRHHRFVGDDGMCNPSRNPSCAPRSTFKDRDDVGFIDRLERRRIVKHPCADCRLLSDSGFSKPSEI